MMIRVVPNQGVGISCQGTRLETEAGEVIPGVRRIELVAEPNDVWRARIDIDVKVEGQIAAILDEVVKRDRE